MNKYCAIFYTHYGAIKFNKFCKAAGIISKLAPVPRKLSSSCTTCVFFDTDCLDIIKEPDKIDDLEGCYLVENECYKNVL